jgi:hypothetical protein
MRSSTLPVYRRSPDLAPSGDLINFYSDPHQRHRGIAALNLPSAHHGLVVAAPRTDIGYLSEELRQAGVSIFNVDLVEVTPDWHRCIAHMLDACLHAQQKHAGIQLFADFAGHVHAPAIFQLESLLRSATREWKVRCVTQYDARRFSDAIDVDALSQFGVVLVGDYYQRGNSFRGRRDFARISEDETVDLSTLE